MTILPEFSSVPNLERSRVIKDAFEKLTEEEKKELKRAGKQITKQVPDVGDVYALEILASIGAIMVKLGEEDA